MLSHIKKLFTIVALGSVVALSGCASTAPPSEPNNICSIFKEKRGWHHAALQAEKKWKVPVHVPMAMMYQESSYIHNARPPKKYILGFIPNGRISSAYGYSQALDGTWAQYQKQTGRGGSRTKFDDSIDFMGWYIDQTHKQNKISKWDARIQYLNYHEGQGGYRRGTHNSKGWLLNTAKRVDSRAKTYRQQYLACQSDLPKGRWW